MTMADIYRANGLNVGIDGDALGYSLATLMNPSERSYAPAGIWVSGNGVPKLSLSQRGKTCTVRLAHGQAWIWFDIAPSFVIGGCACSAEIGMLMTAQFKVSGAVRRAGIGLNLHPFCGRLLGTEFGFEATGSAAHWAIREVTRWQTTRDLAEGPVVSAADLSNRMLNVQLMAPFGNHFYRAATGTTSELFGFRAKEMRDEESDTKVRGACIGFGVSGENVALTVKDLRVNIWPALEGVERLILLDPEAELPDELAKALNAQQDVFFHVHEWNELESALKHLRPKVIIPIPNPAEDRLPGWLVDNCTRAASGDTAIRLDLQYVAQSPQDTGG
jgi:hypothetical protein